KAAAPPPGTNPASAKRKTGIPEIDTTQESAAKRTNIDPAEEDEDIHSQDDEETETDQAPKGKDSATTETVSMGAWSVSVSASSCEWISSSSSAGSMLVLLAALYIPPVSQSCVSPMWMCTCVITEDTFQLNHGCVAV
ncbi:hypothetical protein SARC_14912, partial [Sphaeroforma arctica JP610]